MERNGEATHWPETPFPPHHHCGEGGNFTRGETEAGQGWDLLSFLLLMSSRGMI